MNRRLVLKQLAALAALSAAGTAGYAQQRPGAAFQTLPNKVPTELPGKVEVIEFFSYGCPHCHEFAPMLNGWAKTLATDVNFVKVPVTFGRDQWAAYARLFYALEALGETAKQDAEVFAAIHDRKLPLFRDDALLDWAASRGIDRQRFADTYKSFGVQSRLQRANQLAAAYKVNGVPLMAVDGQYLVSASTAGGYDALLKTVNELIGKARSQARG